MEKNQEYFRGVSVIKIIFITFIIGLIFGLMFFFVKGVRAEDNETKKVVLKEWTTQLLYDTTNACYEGTIRWVLLTHPSLLGQPPNWRSQRQMIEHCFCVMDRIRKEIKIEDYQKLVYDPVWTGNTFMVKAMECVKEEKTLPSFFVIQGGEDNKTVTVPKVITDDNETEKVIPEKPEDSKDELPSQKPKESEEDSTTIFQG
jgi:hypothetical protein